MQEIYSHIISLEIYNIFILLFVLAYGLAFGIKNWIMFLGSIFGRKLRQSDLGKFLDAVWLISVLWLVVVFYSLITD